MGGAGASIEGDPNRVAVFDGSGNLSFLDELQYDYDNKVLVVGEDNPLGNTYGGMFHSAASGVSAGFIQYAIGMASTLAPYFTLVRARGDYDSPQAVANGDIIGRIRARSFDGGQWEETSSELRFVAVGDHDGTNHGMQIEFYVTPSGSTTLTKVMTLLHDGNVNIEAGKTYNVNGVPVGGGSAGAVFQRNLTADLTLNDGESLVVAGYINPGDYEIFLLGDAEIGIA